MSFDSTSSSFMATTMVLSVTVISLASCPRGLSRSPWNFYTLDAKSYDPSGNLILKLLPYIPHFI